MRMKVMPSQRKLMMVTMKLRAAAIDDTPSTSSPITQKSTRIPGEYCVEVRLAYPNQPASGAPPKRKLAFMNSAPRKKTQKLNAFRRGNATSRAPICSGTMKLKKAALSGMMARNTIVVPCMVNN